VRHTVGFGGIVAMPVVSTMSYHGERCRVRPWGMTVSLGKDISPTFDVRLKTSKVSAMQLECKPRAGVTPSLGPCKPCPEGSAALSHSRRLNKPAAGVSASLSVQGALP
jgi:hypothetical protein